MLRLPKILPFLLWLALTSPIFGASVEKVNRTTGTILIGAGKSDGLSKGDKVCFFNDNGKKIGCGTVRKLKKNAALVKVGKKAAKRIKEGYATDVKGGGGGGPSGASKLKLAYILTPMTPASYNKLTYLPPDGAPQVDSLWAVTEKASNSFVGFGAEYELGLSGGNALAVGGRLRLYREFTSQADYDGDPTHFAEVNQTGTAIGLWADYYFLKIGSLRLGAGADLDMSTQTFAAGFKTDAGDEQFLAEATTKATVISLRTVAAMELFLDPIGFHIGANILLPLTSSVSGSADVVDQANGGKLTVDPNEDLLAAINHKSQFGLELFLAAFIAF